MMANLDESLQTELAALAERGRLRTTRPFETPPGPRAQIGGRSLINFGSNNYLGLAEHPAVRRAASEAAERWGTGSTGSRLLSGNLPPHAALEAALASFLGEEAALLFSSGYLAAVGTIPALVGRGDLILSDALNHASLIDGCRLSRAEVRVYRHADAAHAAARLADRQAFRRCLLVTDGVFSMDGDAAPLAELADLAQQCDAWLMVDDAHGLGVLGRAGRGSVEAAEVEGRVAVRMGTLSKALGSEGGFVAGSRTLVQFLINRARSFIFSTAPSPASVAAAQAALRVLRTEPERRQRVLLGAAKLRAGLVHLGYQSTGGESAIIPVLVGADAEAVRLSRQLEEQGVWAPAIRPPSVPVGSARLRLAVTADHSAKDIETALRSFAEARG